MNCTTEVDYMVFKPEFLFLLVPFWRIHYARQIMKMKMKNKFVVMKWEAHRNNKHCYATNKPNKLCHAQKKNMKYTRQQQFYNLCIVERKVKSICILTGQTLTYLTLTVGLQVFRQFTEQKVHSKSLLLEWEKKRELENSESPVASNLVHATRFVRFCLYYFVYGLLHYCLKI